MEMLNYVTRRVVLGFVLVFVFGLTLAGCVSTGASAIITEDPAMVVEKLAADLNAIKADSATVSGDTVTLTADMRLETALTVPTGVTFDLTKNGLQLGNGATLTVNGTVNAKADGVRIDSATATPATINGNGTINLKSKGRLLYIGEGKKLTLDGVTLVGLADNDSPLVGSVGGEFAMKSGAITGNTNTTRFGGGVVINGNGTFIMEGGVISGNSAEWGGGLHIGGNGGGSFIMNGGTIYGSADHLPAGTDASLANSAGSGDSGSIGGAALQVQTRVRAMRPAKWGTGGTYTVGGVSQTGDNEIVTTNDTLIAIPGR